MTRIRKSGRLGLAVVARIRPFLLFAAATVWAGAVPASVEPPRLFFTDLTAAPNSGGQKVNDFSGAYITIYGNFFGASQASSTVTWNGQDCLRVVGPVDNYNGWGSSHLWYQKIIVQLGTACTPGTGNFVVTTSAGASNGLSFTVRAIGANHIYFAATSGGNYSSIASCAAALKAGDICYVRNGLNQDTATANGVPLVLGHAVGTSWDMPISIVTYPGAKSQIGNDNFSRAVYECYAGIGACNGPRDHYIIVAGFTMRATGPADAFSNNQSRRVGNYVTCPAMPFGAQTGCMSPMGSNLYVYGNEIAYAAANLLSNNKTAGKLAHNVYFGLPLDGTPSHDIDFGWNSSHDMNGGRDLQFNGTISYFYNVSVHDNLLYNTVGCGCMVGEGDVAGDWNVYNNVIHDCAQVLPSAAPKDNYGDNGCVNFTSIYGKDNPVNVYNNTIYNCGTTAPYANGNPAGIHATQRIIASNNIIVQPKGAPYKYLDAQTSGSFAGSFSGSNNVYSGAGPGPSFTVGNVNADPRLMSTGDFHLQAGSPAVAAGIITALVADHDGRLRPQNAPSDAGAYQFSSALTPIGTLTPTCNITVASAINQALGSEPCTTANLAGDGCTVVDVQRVLNYQVSPARGCQLGK